MASSTSGQTFWLLSSVVPPTLQRKRMAARRKGPEPSSKRAASAPLIAVAHERESNATSLVRISRTSQRVCASGRLRASTNAEIWLLSRLASLSATRESAEALLWRFMREEEERFSTRETRAVSSESAVSASWDFSSDESDMHISYPIRISRNSIARHAREGAAPPGTARLNQNGGRTGRGKRKAPRMAGPSVRRGA